MLNVKGQLERMGYVMESPIRSLQIAREQIEKSSNPHTAAVKIIADIIGQNDVSLPDDVDPKLIAMGVVERTVRANGDVPEGIVDAVSQHVRNLMINPATSWMFLREEYRKEAEQELKMIVEDVDVKVPVKEDGSIKKGGKQILARELYKKHILEADQPMSTQDFIALLMKHLDMTKSGATTYAYNCKRDLGAKE